MLGNVINLSNALGAVSFCTLICIPGAVEGEMYITAIVLMVISVTSAYFALKENGQIKK